MLILFIMLLTIIIPTYIQTMELNDSPRSQDSPRTNLVIHHKRKITIFDPKEVIAKGTPLTAWFNSNLTLTPDEKKVLISTHGKIYVGLTTDLFGGHPAELLIKHPSSKLSTMVTASKQSDKSIKIVSGANFFNKDRQKWTSEIIIYNDKTKSHIVKYYDWPLQAIKFNPQGTFLIGANLSSILLFDLEGIVTDCLGFHIPSSEHSSSCALNRLVDLAINPNFLLIAAGKNGSTKLMDVSKAMSNTKQNLWKDAIKTIHFPTEDTIIYSTPDGQSKTIDMYDLLESQKRSKADDFSHSSTHTQVCLNTSNTIAVAHWTNNESLSEDERTTIYVYRINNDEREVFELYAKFDKPTYYSISNTGQLEEHMSHFLTTAFFGNTLVALSTNGELFVWHLPPLQTNIPYQENKEKDKEEISNRRGLTRTRSKSSDITPHTSRTNLTPEKSHSRKSSPRKPLNFMKIITPRSGSPRHSRNSSPIDSPRDNNVTDIKL